MIESARRWIRDWAGASLKRKLALTLSVSLTIASICFLALLVWSYRDRVLEERSFASTQINRLLQVGLENAMLNRDIEGLRQMVDRLGRQEKIAGVMILAPDGETRFASNRRQLGRRFDLAAGELCPGCRSGRENGGTKSAFLTDPVTGAVLRSVNPVANREPCTQCHGPIEKNPINGILVVDYDARQLNRHTLVLTLGLSGAGLLVLLGAIGGIGWMLGRSVIQPVQKLTTAAEAMTLGQLGRRVELSGRDEISKLGEAFNAMAFRIEKGVRDVEERERYLQSMIDAMPDGVRVIDQSYRVVKANAAFRAQAKRQLGEIIGQPCYMSSHKRDEPCPTTLVTCPLHELRNGGGALTYRHRHVRADGSDLHVEVSAAPLEVETAEGKNRMIVEVIRDLNQELRHSQEQRLSEIGFLAAGVAHEIRNPLASIQFGFASVNRHLEEGRYAAVADYMRVIEEEIGRCIDVTSRLLKLSASPSEQPELVVMNDVVADMLSLLKAEALRSGVEMTVDMAPKMRVIASDSEMRMLVLNLAQNAIHAMPNGGRLSVVGRIEGESVTLAFQDTGIGIRDEDLSRIFDPFWSRRADGVQGTGLGLPICREILNHSGGKIAVTSELGKGTRFTIALPSADARLGPE